MTAPRPNWARAELERRDRDHRDDAARVNYWRWLYYRHVSWLGLLVKAILAQPGGRAWLLRMANTDALLHWLLRDLNLLALKGRR